MRHRRVRKRVTGERSLESGEKGKRRRRRRSKSSAKDANLKQNKRQFYVVTLIFFSGFFLALAGTLSIGYHNSRSFRGKLLADLESGSGAAVSLSQLRVSPTLATARQLEYTWGEEEGGFSKVVLENVSTHYLIGGLLGGTWSGSDLSAKSGKVYMKRGKSGEAVGVDQFDYKSKYGLDRIKCAALNIYSANGRLLIKESFAHFKWGGDPMQLQLSGGSLGDTEFGVEQGYVNIRPDSNELFLQLAEKNGVGRVEVKGVIEGIDPTPFTLKVTNLPSSVLFGESISKLILGNWSGDNGQLTLEQANKLETKYDIHLTAQNLNFGRLDCFAVLAGVLKNNNYRRPQFRNGGELHVIKDGGKISIEDLSCTDRRGGALRGSLRAEGGVIEGLLKVGVPLHEKATLEKHFKVGAFSSSSDGYLWETVDVSGKLGALKDDLREKLRAEGGQLVKPQNRPAVEVILNKAPKTQEEIEAAFEQLISK